MRYLALALAGLTLVGAGCRSKPESTDTDRREPAAAKPAAEKASGPATVEIDSEMLRDLRITTTKAESRPGGEAVNLQGELRIDETRYAQVGTPIAARALEPSKPAFEIAELSTLWLVVHAFEREAVRVKVGAPARVTLPAMPGRTFTGTVRLVGRQVDVESRTVPVRLDMPNPDRTLRPGMAGMAAIVLSETAGRIIAVPVAALQRMTDRWVVFIPKGASTFEVRTVGRGRDLNGEVEILSGLRQDETVVVDGSFLLKAEADKARGEGEHEH